MKKALFAAAFSLIAAVGTPFVVLSEEVLYSDDITVIDDFIESDDISIADSSYTDSAYTDNSGYDDSAVSDDIPLIEDSGELIVSQEGSALYDVLAAEDAAARAQEEAVAATHGLIADSELVVESAGRESLQKYLLGLLDLDDPMGSDGEMKIAAYIENEMKALGYTTSPQNFHKGTLDDDYVDLPGINILAERGANSDSPTSEIILICTHYDSKPDPEEDDPFPNDKSGAAVVMETARILSQTRSDRDICFVFLSGEEQGHCGALRFMESLNETLRSQIRCAIYVDTIGTTDLSPYLLGTGDGEANEPATVIRSTALAMESEILLEGKTVQTPLTKAQNGYETEDWAFVKDLPSGRTYLEEAGVTSVRLFQDIDHMFTKEALDKAALAEAGDASGSEETEPLLADTQKSNPVRIALDLSRLQYVTDILVQTVGTYMVGVTAY